MTCLFALSSLFAFVPSDPCPGLNTILRGGGGGAAATRRRRKAKTAQFEVMQKLCSLLGPLLDDSSKFGKPKKTKKKRSAESADAARETPSLVDTLVDELGQLVEKIKKKPCSLISELEGFLLRAKSTSSKPMPSKSPGKIDGPVTAKTNLDKPVQSTNKALHLARHCWNVGEIKDFGEVMRVLQLGEAPQGSISLAPSLAKAFEARELAIAHNLHDSLKFACVVAGLDHSALPDGVVSAVLPVTVGTGVVGPGIRSTRFENMACILLGAERPKLPTGLVKEVKTVPPKVDFVTLRFHVPRAFQTAEQWSFWTKNPGATLLQWVGDTSLIHNCYGWSSTDQTSKNGNKEEFLVGYAKVQSSKLQQILQKSGKSGVFCDRLAKDRDCNLWVAWEDVGNLDASSYLAHVVKRAQTKAAELHEFVVPLAWRAGGGNCLGLRLKQRPASSVVIWRAKSVAVCLD